ncbi:MAG TPA: PQQ-binding-like beta-propeller repeat protein [Polyangia bacterium]
MAFSHQPAARTARVSLLIAVLCGCGSSTLHRASEPRREYPASVAQMRWRTVIHPYSANDSQPEECATGVLVGSRLILGSRDGKVMAVNTATGSLIWSVPVSGAVDSEALFDLGRGQVYLGTDDGFFYAIDPNDGKIRWSYKGKGSIERKPELGSTSVYFSTSSNRVFSLEAATGNKRWQYEREAPEGFSIHGRAGVRLGGDVLYTGFDDGYLVALGAETGDLRWARSLAAASDQFVDVDSTPILRGDHLFAASYSGGLYAVRATDGEVAWRMGVEGVVAIGAGTNQLYVASPRDGLAAVTMKGSIAWRQGLSQAGDLSPPQEVGPYLIFTGSRAGLFVVDRATGQLLQGFDPGRGMCAAPLVDIERRELYVLANSGTLYAMSLSW